MFQIVPASDYQGDNLRQKILDVMSCYNMHHVPSAEMDELDLNCFFIALVGEELVGASGYKMLNTTTGKTTLLAVTPAYSKHGIGLALQQARVKRMKELGAKKIITNADRPETITWYKKQGYVEIGKLPKIHEFGLPHVQEWTTLQLNCS